MAKTLIGNVKGKDGRGISKIEKTATTGTVDTYTITYTDSTQSTYEVRNSDDIAIQRQIVPSAAVESSATASQSYAKGNYVVVNGILRKVTSAIAKGNTISDSNSTATTVCGELGSLTEPVHHEVSIASGWDASSDKYVEMTSCGHIVTLNLRIVNSAVYGNGSLVCTVPEGLRPNHEFVYAVVTMDAGSGAAIGNVYVEPTGEVKVTSYLSNPRWVVGAMTWII